MSYPATIEPIKQYLLQNGVSESPEAAVILGSGLGGFSSSIKNYTAIPYNSIPGFPETSVQGHSGELIFGEVADKPILAFSGRFHHYEGHPFERTVLPVHLAKAFDVEKLIISNAAGAINTRFKVGDLMVIDDVFRPFYSVASTSSPRFKYNLYKIADDVRKIGASIGLDLQRGTYLFANGPNYETKAEIRAFRVLGADVVGMSTAPELIEASRLNLKAAAISMVTNMAAGVVKGKLDHSEVKIAAETRKEDFARLVTELVKKL
ncbi:purine-nucleoside phosphorylase [Rhodohalobacter sp. SW132]|uniref:purine-nucleoside phosphorylase n=1 Tax=Rhodohalobacter sp. SW132 TaxID=2293433 RepID=UPI000E258044|nr:purine-nucleoside phosphorylase [Rhodohalobacter sp. SW132]REL33286.1 purine-nucleoside phosphorylase [Rhodohalobacter sp. SW132]